MTVSICLGVRRAAEEARARRMAAQASKSGGGHRLKSNGADIWDSNVTQAARPVCRLTAGAALSINRSGQAVTSPDSLE